MTKPQKVSVGIIFIALIVALAFVFTTLYNKSIESLPDNIRFFREYPAAGEDNTFKYLTDKEAVEFLKNGTGIILFGFPSCKWCQEYVSVLSEVAWEYDVSEVYYLNIKKIRKENTVEYQELVNLLTEYLPVNDDGEKIIFVPETVFVKDGKILGHNNDTATLSGVEVEDYYTEQFRGELKNKLRQLTIKLYPASCNDENIEC